MPFHENEYDRESVRCALEHVAGNHFAGAGAQTRGDTDSAHARAEQIKQVAAIHLNHLCGSVNRPYDFNIATGL